MKRILTILLVTLLFLTACAGYKVIKPGEQAQTTSNQPNQTEPKPTINVNLTSEFKIVAQQAIRNPPTVKGAIKNFGAGAGDAKVVASIYYGGVVASERTQDLTNIKSEEQRNFSIIFDNVTQWTSYSVHIE